MVGWDEEECGGVMIGQHEVVIRVRRKGEYYAWSNSGEKILQITEDGEGINAITKEEGNTIARFY